MDINKSKKEFQVLIEKVVLKSTFLIGLLLAQIFFILPLFDEVQIEKEDLKSNAASYTQMLHKGLSYEALKSQNIAGEPGVLLSRAGNDFFSSNFTNNKGWQYLDFLQKKQVYVNDLKSNNTIQIRDQKLSKVLPMYSDASSVEGVMNDFVFVNYLENLLRGFNLKTVSQLWVEQITSLENSSTDTSSKVQKNKKSSDNYSPDLYYIPLTLELEWRKSDLVDFLYYSQNIWRVESIKNESILFYSDDILKNTFLSQVKMFQPNIYENKIFEIESIDFDKYLDSEVLSRDDKMKNTLWLMSFIKNTSQKDELIKVQLKLRFYIKGIPNYKIEQYIQNMIQAYKNNHQQVKTMMKQSQTLKSKLIETNQLSLLSELQTLDLYFSDNDAYIKLLEWSVKKKEINENIYKKASVFWDDIAKISAKLENISKKLTLLQNKK